jgi:hypothetical protein
MGELTGLLPILIVVGLWWLMQAVILPRAGVST